VACNAANLDVGNFLLLESEGETLIKRLTLGETTDLEAFTNSKDCVLRWRDLFVATLSLTKPMSDTFSKQVYFPLKDSYHLLSPLFASSLNQRIVEKLDDARFGDIQKEARDFKKKEKYSSTLSLSYPQTSIHSFGGTNAQNISKLNHKKGFPRFCSAPPSWKSQRNISLNHADSFWRYYGRQVKSVILKIKAFITQYKETTSNMKLRSLRAALLDEAVDIFFECIATVRDQNAAPGWSDSSKLVHCECLLLDSANTDVDFQNIRAEGAWREELVERYARWMSKQLSDKTTTMADSESEEFSAVLTERIRCVKDYF
jgi:CRISPR-associated protein Csy1